MVFFDPRWTGDNGIGVFARHVGECLDLPSLPIGGVPTEPLDPLRQALVMSFRVPRGGAVFNPGYTPLLFPVRPFVFTVHDLNHIDRPENSSPLKRLYYSLVMRPALRRAFRVLTVSEFSKRRIVEWARVAAERVVVVGNGVDASFSPDGARYAPGYRYLLCVGNRKSHKNELRALEAFAQAEIDRDIRLLFTGEASPELAERVRGLGLAGRVEFSGRVPQADVPALYRGALALVFPSLYEGFGLPVIEAMACGTPVLTSNTTALPETAGDAALLVDPLSVPAIAEGIERLCNDAELAARLRHRGLERAENYNWKDVCRRVRAVINELEKEGARK